MPPTRAPEPSRNFFDPFNSSSSGHQRAENRLSGSTSWRDSRSYKLAHQFGDTSGGGGELHRADLVGAGSENWGKDERKENGSWELGVPGLRDKGWQDIRGLMRGKKRKSEESANNVDGDCKKRKGDVDVGSSGDAVRTESQGSLVQVPSQALIESSALDAGDLSVPKTKEATSSPQIFRSLTLYINGSTHSSGVSDHKLKNLFIQHGGSLSIGLARRTVTHVILGSDGLSLAAGKIQKEVAKVGGKGMKYVTAKWVVDSVECGKRLPESQYQAVHTAMKGQKSVLGNFSNMKQQPGEDDKEK